MLIWTVASIAQRRGTCVVAAALIVCLTTTLACRAQPAGITPEELLKSTMAKYATLRTFEAESKTETVTVTATESVPDKATRTSSERSIAYSRPSRFAILGYSGTPTCPFAIISDGVALADHWYSVEDRVPARMDPAPVSITELGLKSVADPGRFGSPLYLFFAGPANYPKLVYPEKPPPAFGPKLNLSGEECITVVFYASGYGTTEVAIGANDGLIHRIIYHNEDLVRIEQAITPRVFSGGRYHVLPTVTAKVSTEVFGRIKCNEHIENKVFAVKAVRERTDR